MDAFLLTLLAFSRFFVFYAGRKPIGLVAGTPGLDALVVVLIAREHHQHQGRTDKQKRADTDKQPPVSALARLLFHLGSQTVRDPLFVSHASGQLADIGVVTQFDFFVQSRRLRHLEGQKHLFQPRPEAGPG